MNAEPRRLLHVMPSFGVGGIQVRFVRLANLFGGKYRHGVVALDRVWTCRARLDSAVPFEPIEVDFDKTKPLSAMWAFRRTLARYKPDLLLTYNWGSIEWAFVDRFLPVARHVHFEDGFGVEEAKAQFPRRVRFRGLALKRTKRVVVPSRVLEGIALDVWRLRRDQVAYVPNGVDLDRFAAAPDPSLSPALAKRPGEPVVGTVAPLRPEKNIGRLLHAFAAIAARTPARLVVVGDGAERPGLESLARDLGLADRIAFAGRIDTPELVLGAFDVFAMSSDTEQMPLTILEAMAASRPVASVDVGDVAVMVAAENRPFVTTAGDAPALGEAILRLLADAELRRRIGAANRARAAADFPQQAMFDAYDRIYSL